MMNIFQHTWIKTKTIIKSLFTLQIIIEVYFYMSLYKINPQNISHTHKLHTYTYLFWIVVIIVTFNQHPTDIYYKPSIIQSFLIAHKIPQHSFYINMYWIKFEASINTYTFS